VRQSKEIGASAFDVDAWPPFRLPLPLPQPRYFGRKSFVLMRLAVVGSAKILHSNELAAKYWNKKS
jgi:hypothetical protein